ncbi:2-amino-4-hydroxy-6-hydroxymethyldihydropteridine diphosphokinase [Derxia gummosa]|uniref:2-amino-4-hydroxy-6-hydroxymethyldihydropteridine pyrophosphokinase n=1 Tax=Derxia gummosa DSM 723 TaxID=1121388 RepID=A0A8B6XC49_9BURK|nr:2-amino-4-hydroxy-6-hydroxymethyldihydropteridine diphosphokinase [Derxia gummosa]
MSPAPSAPARRRAVIGLGANLGDADGALRHAAAALLADAGSRLVAASCIWTSAPIDSSGPDYRNAVLILDTPLAPHDLLARLQLIELDHGRERPYRNAPRTLDLDLLLSWTAAPASTAAAAPPGSQTGTLWLPELVTDAPVLLVPHPRAHERRFVLGPLAEIAPDTVIPGHGRTADLLAALHGQPAAPTGLPLVVADSPSGEVTTH